MGFFQPGILISPVENAAFLLIKTPPAVNLGAQLCLRTRAPSAERGFGHTRT